MSGDVRLIRSPLSVTGMVLTTISAVLFLVVFLADLIGLHTNPYIGIVFFLILPGVFIIGLVLIPLGAWIEKRRRAAGRPPSAAHWPRIDLNVPRQRKIAIAVFALTMANVVIVSLAAYKGVEYMDSVSFCGQACHTPMGPEFISRAQEPHANITCVKCHVGPGASSFVKSKLAGTRRVLGVMTGRYTRPIVAEADELLAATQTCEQCHWPEKFHGDLVRSVTEYADDEKNTASVTTLKIHVGGGDERQGLATGIHWHMNVTNEIEYIATDKERQTIPYVSLKDRDGNVREFVADGVTPEQLAAGERRRMDCMDCHNRPSHVIAASPERAVDAALTEAAIPGSLPFVRREAVKALKATYSSQESARAEIASALGNFYRGPEVQGKSVPAADIEKAVAAVQDIYRRNVFPEMNVKFGTYPSNIGHIDSPGCFRCHDDNHKSKDGRSIGQDCELCHAIE